MLFSKTIQFKNKGREARKDNSKEGPDIRTLLIWDLTSDYLPRIRFRGNLHLTFIRWSRAATSASGFLSELCDAVHHSTGLLRRGKDAGCLRLVHGDYNWCHFSYALRSQSSRLESQRKLCCPQCRHKQGEMYWSFRGGSFLWLGCLDIMRARPCS